MLGVYYLIQNPSCNHKKWLFIRGQGGKNGIFWIAFFAILCIQFINESHKIIDQTFQDEGAEMIAGMYK